MRTNCFWIFGSFVFCLEKKKSIVVMFVCMYMCIVSLLITLLFFRGSFFFLNTTDLKSRINLKAESFHLKAQFQKNINNESMCLQ